jgi:hypothetical protein
MRMRLVLRRVRAGGESVPTPVAAAQFARRGRFQRFGRKALASGSGDVQPDASAFRLMSCGVELWDAGSIDPYWKILRMVRWTRLFVFASLLCSASTLVAHPGHGTTAPDTVEHYVFEPVHAIPVVVLVAAIAVGVVVRRRRRSH